MDILRIHSYTEGSGWISLYSVYTAIQRVQVGYHYTPYTQLYRGFKLDILRIHSYTEGSGTQLYRGFRLDIILRIYTAIQRVQVGYTPYTQLHRGFRLDILRIHSHTEGLDWIYSVYKTIRFGLYFINHLYI